MSSGHAIITGAASGIGAVAVQRWIRRGGVVTAVDLNPGVTEKYAGADRVHAVVGDTTDTSFVDDLVREANQRRPVTQLFHSAGIMPGGEIADVPADDILKVMHVNYAGTVTMVKAVLPSMRQRQQGQIVILGSVTGYFPTNKFAAYSASKAAVNTFAETLAEEERRHGIHVLLVAPNAVKTPLLSQASKGPAGIAKIAEGKSRMGMTPEDVLDSIEKALTKNKSIVLPGARSVYLLRRLSPRLAWFIIRRINQ
jgi:NAD(P)-dependent dehydrogenase (short-subunit alcohol dehydrogenase family)